MASQMPEIHTALTVDLPRMRYFPQMLEYLVLEGFKFTSVDLVYQRVECRRRSIATGRIFRFVIWVYGRGDSQTGLLVGVERPLVSRLYLDKQEFVDMLRDLERVLRAAVGHELVATPQIARPVGASSIRLLDAVAA